MIKTFIEYLVEGGNVTIDGVKPEGFSVSHHNRQQLQHEIHHGLHEIHNLIHQKHHVEIFGHNAHALKNGSAYSGSTKHLMNKELSHEEFAKHKPHVGDVDVQVPHEHLEHISKALTKGTKVGNFTVHGSKKIAGEVHVVLKHNQTGKYHQFDFEGTKYNKHSPSHFDRFSHSSDWEDTKQGFKGVHHKTLLNAVGREKHKFSSMHGLGERHDDKKKDSNWQQDTHKIAHTLFGKNANEKDLHSFHGLTKLVKEHIPAKEHQKIFDKFKDSLRGDSDNDKKALEHLRKNLHVK